MREDLEGYPSIDELAEDYEFFGEFFTKDMMMEKGVGLAAGAGGLLLVQNVMDRIDYFADKPVWRSVTELVVGVGGGRALYNYNRPASFAFLGAVGGLALASLIQQGMAYAEAQMQPEAGGEAPVEGMRGLGQQTRVTAVPPYIDRYKTSVPRSFTRSGVQGVMVSRANYLQTRGMAGGVGEGGNGNGDAPDDGEGELPEVGTWLMGT